MVVFSPTHLGSCSLWCRIDPDGVYTRDELPVLSPHFYGRIIRSHATKLDTKWQVSGSPNSVTQSMLFEHSATKSPGFVKIYTTTIRCRCQWTRLREPSKKSLSEICSASICFPKNTSHFLNHLAKRNSSCHLSEDYCSCCFFKRSDDQLAGPICSFGKACVINWSYSILGWLLINKPL